MTRGTAEKGAPHKSTTRNLIVVTGGFVTPSALMKSLAAAARIPVDAGG